MSFIKSNHEEANSFDVLPAGAYECVISKVEVKQTKNKDNMIACELTIRSDVQQAGKKRKLFTNLIDLPQCHFQFHQMFKAVGIPSGVDFASIGDVAKAISNKKVCAVVKVTQYQGLDKNEVSYVKEPSEGSSAVSSPFGSAPSNDPFATTAKHSDDPFANMGGKIDITEDDLPF